MLPLLRYTVDTISKHNPIHGKKLTKTLSVMDDVYFRDTESFLVRYRNILEQEGQNIDFAIQCYLKMLADISYETVAFVRSGQYSSTSLAEVNERVYGKPDVMNSYLHGLILRQFLFVQNYKIWRFFSEVFQKTGPHIKHYLEVGGGHGLFLSEALTHSAKGTIFSLLDISETSLNLSRRMVDNNNVNYILSDIFNFQPENKFDFICMGEVLEHVENPVALLEKLRSMLSADGVLFLTTVTNAPAIDHIYLFRNTSEIHEVIHKAGFSVMEELCLWSEDMPPERAERLQVGMMWAGKIHV